MASRADLTTDDALELVLLAAVAYPDLSLRARIAARLSSHIEAGRPFFSEQQVRDFLANQTGLLAEPFLLEPAALELAVRLLRLVFSRRTPGAAESWVRIVGSQTRNSEGGLLISSGPLFGLQGEYLPPSADLTRLNRQLRPSRLIAPLVETRLRDLPAERNAVSVSCEAKDGFRLTIRGEGLWSRLDARAVRNFQEHSALGSGKTLSALGLLVEVGERKALCIRTTTPESVIRFSACLARDERLVLRRRSSTADSALVIALREFKGESAEFPSLLVCPVREPWTNLPPCPALRLDIAERLAIARWLYPPVPWMNRPLLDGLLPRGPVEGNR